MPNLILVSKSRPDVEFFVKLCGENGWKLIPVISPTGEGLYEQVLADPKALVLWNLDSEEPEVDGLRPLIKVPNINLNILPAERAFALTSKPIMQYAQYLREEPNYGKHFIHNMLRRYSPAALRAYAGILRAAFEPKAEGLKSVFPAGTAIQSIDVRSTKHRAAAVEAVRSLLEKRGFDPRVAANAAKAVDELLMNAIFDAPSEKNTGNFTRHHVDRRAQFELASYEKLILEIAFTDDYLGICVSDFFGSIDKGRVFEFVGQNFMDADYTVRRNARGSGLGLYGIVHSGLSLLFVAKPGERTDAIALFPKSTSYKEFKQAFQAFAYLSVK